LETRAGEKEQGLEYLEKAARLETTGIRYRYVYGVALHDTGQPEAALAHLKSLLRQAPANPDLLLALATYSKAAGNTEDARRYASKLAELMPEDPGVRQFYESL
jgi:Flp pilus assembly protein TadD